jgi:hypothetical protein
MLSNPLQYYPQNLGPQNLGLPFSGPQAAGWPQQIGAGLGQPAAYNGTAQFGQGDGQAGFGLPAANPYLQSQWQSPVAYNPLHNPFIGSFAGHAGAGIPAHQIVPVLGQLAHQIAVQSSVTQQIGLAVHHLAHQLASQAAGVAGGGFGAGQAFAASVQPYIGGSAQPFGAQPFGTGQPGMGQPFGLSGQGGYGGGFGPQTQGWGQAWGGRPQTIQ